MHFALFRFLSQRDTPHRLLASSKRCVLRGRNYERRLGLVDLRGPSYSKEKVPLCVSTREMLYNNGHHNYIRLLVYASNTGIRCNMCVRANIYNNKFRVYLYKLFTIILEFHLSKMCDQNFYDKSFDILTRKS